ncbi:MAG: PIN domain-containing protein [Cyanobacteria bacterium J06634_6]
MTGILDTSFLFALANKTDRNHSRVLATAQKFDEPLLLPCVVIPEVCYLIASRLGHSKMREFLNSLSASGTELEPTVGKDWARIHEILEQYADSQLDFVDTAIIAIAERKNISRVLTLDRRDFSVMRPKHCDYFEILP